ncbi:MAG: aminopeptidase [Promethearchaeota archaeon]|nr:MAG: aminopeptidase [Candidatus Lokiarchaeota archaeon]
MNITKIMINPFYEKLAKLAVNYSIEVKKGDRVFVLGPILAEELFRALYVEIIKAGGHALLFPFIEGLGELLFKYASEDQLTYVDEVRKQIHKEFDCMVAISADYNTKNLSLVDPELLSKRFGSPQMKELWDLWYDRAAKKEAKWVIIPFPCNAFAQDANMDLISYSNFIEKALFLDNENPIQEWQKIEKDQEKYVNYLNEVEIIQIIGEDTDLTMSTKGRSWENDCGHENLPDGEVATSPVENSVIGSIRFTYPAIHLGNEVENIYLEFKDGRVVNSTADKGEKFLREILKIENADRLGEFAIGTNYGITEFSKNILFDEKMGGTIHLALGDGFKELGSKNESAIHWDILKDMKKPGSKIIADDRVIYEEGKWKI